MNPLRRSPLNSIIFALAVTAAVLLGSIIVDPYLAPGVFPLFLGAVWASAWYGGKMGGFTATAACCAGIFYFILRPESGSAASYIGWRVLTFLAIASLLTWMTSSWSESRRLVAATLSSISDGVIATDRDGRITFLNSVAETLTGWPRHEALRKPAADVVRFIDESTGEAVENPLIRALRERTRVEIDDRLTLLSRSGSSLPVEHSASPVRDESGVVWGAILVFRDVTKRRQLEEQATHAQKMEAVGRLAGGVAGDFNNVLTVITGYAELLRAEVVSGSPLRRFVDEIIYAGERAAALTQHLLAFSRRGAAQPSALDLNHLIGGMEPMLRRLLGQGIELILLKSPGLGRIWADASQIEQAVINLATNAREAMPQGGKLVIETANVNVDDGPAGKNVGVKPGSYVMMAMSDTGVGMDAETRSRLFEPFFTTKAQGQGSGLGLSMVYGTIKQSEGQVTVYSQPGCGTIFEIYLPRVKDVAVEAPRRRSAKGSETILLVDDEEGVRKLVSAVLASNGYDVIEASNGAAALAAYEKNGHKVDLVLTDVVMPQMTGFELGRQLVERAPSLKILYMSGYRDNSPGTNGGEVPKAFLHKPFTPDTLLAKVREVLDAGTGVES